MYIHNTEMLFTFCCLFHVRRRKGNNSEQTFSALRRPAVATMVTVVVLYALSDVYLLCVTSYFGLLVSARISVC